MAQARRALLIGVPEPLEDAVSADLRLLDATLRASGYAVEVLPDAGRSRIRRLVKSRRAGRCWCTSAGTVCGSGRRLSRVRAASTTRSPKGIPHQRAHVVRPGHLLGHPSGSRDLRRNPHPARHLSPLPRPHHLPVHLRHPRLRHEGPLQQLRRQAEGWRAGLTGLTALLAILVTLKGRDDLQDPGLVPLHGRHPDSHGVRPAPHRLDPRGDQASHPISPLRDPLLSGRNHPGVSRSDRRMDDDGDGPRPHPPDPGHDDDRRAVRRDAGRGPRRRTYQDAQEPEDAPAGSTGDLGGTGRELPPPPPRNTTRTEGLRRNLGADIRHRLNTLRLRRVSVGQGSSPTEEP